MTKNNKKNNQCVEKQSYKVLNIFLFMIFLFSGGLYLYNINQITVQGFELQETETELDYLAEKNRGLEEELNSSQSYYAFSSRVELLQMVEESDVIYLTRNKQVLAKK